MPDIIILIIYSSIYIGIVSTTFFILTFLEDKKKSKIFYTEKELPKVTILIPAYNEETTIKQTIDSIINSNYPKNKFEVIVINDGSKDKTLEIARKISEDYKNKGFRIKILTKENAGKGTALNLGIKKSKGEIIFTMDADTTVHKNSLKNMTKYFKNKEVMSVTPAMIIRKPKNLIQRIQHIEYLTGLFLRKVFAALNAVHITPGAFSAYRRSFFDKYGVYDETNITEDLEMSLRIQYHKFKIENSAESPAYTIAPAKFSHLLKQRRRWYVGLMKNIWHYKKLFGKEYGDLGVFVLPLAWISILFSLFVTLYFFIKTITEVNKEILFYKSINFDFGNLLDLNLFFFERIFFRLASNSIIIFILLFITIIGTYLYYASKKTGKIQGLFLNLPLFFIFFSVFFGFWWVVSIFYVILNKDISWK